MAVLASFWLVPDLAFLILQLSWKHSTAPHPTGYFNIAALNEILCVKAVLWLSVQFCFGRVGKDKGNITCGSIAWEECA